MRPRARIVAILCTTSGTTANPKLAMLAAGRVLRHCATYLAFDPKGPDDEYVSVLPLPWIMEQVYVLGKGLLCRMKVNFVEEPETMMHDFREIAPTFVLFAPRVWESIAADVRARVMDASPLKQRLYDIGMKPGLAALARGQALDPCRRAAVPRAARPARLHPPALGGDRRRGARPRHLQVLPGHGRAAAHALRPDRTARRLHAASARARSIPIRPASPMADDIEIRVDNPDVNGVGEIVVRHPNMFLGYYKNPEASAADIKDGWMHSGDAGYFNDDKQLVVIDRIKDLAETSRGERFSPQYHREQAEILALHRRGRGARRRPRGARRDDLHPLFHHLEMGGEEPHVVHDLYRPRLAARGLRAAAEGGRGVNATLPPAQRISRFLLLYKELDADDGELTRTRKGPPQRHQREICRHHRRDLSPATPDPRRHRDPLPGRHHPAHPHHAESGRPRARDPRRMAEAADHEHPAS